MGHAKQIVEENEDIKCLRIIIDQEQVNVRNGCVQCSLVKNLNFPLYLIEIIALFVAAVPQELLDKEEEERKKAMAIAKKNKKKKKRRTNARRGRGRGRV